MKPITDIAMYQLYHITMHFKRQRQIQCLITFMQVLCFSNYVTQLHVMFISCIKVTFEMGSLDADR